MEVFIRDKYEKKKYIDKCINIQTFRVSAMGTTVPLLPREPFQECFKEMCLCFH